MLVLEVYLAHPLLLEGVQQVLMVTQEKLLIIIFHRKVMKI